MTPLNVESLGEFLREQRASAEFSVRQLAEMAGVSNPYLSQIERGMRKPSAEILQQLAKALQISAETLYVRAGILDERDGAHEVTAAVLSDMTLNDRQKRVLLDIYDSFRRENDQPPTSRPTPAAAKETAQSGKQSAKPPTKKSAKPPTKKTAKKSAGTAPKKTTKRSTKKAPPP